MPTALVLGAGATLANAVHFRSRRKQAFQPPLDYTFFERIRGLGIPVPTELRRYADTLDGPNPFDASPGVVTHRMEEFFVDLFYDFQDSESGGLADTAYSQLIDVYVRVLRETTDWMRADGRSGGPVGRLIAASGDEVTVVTFNQDLVIENEIEKRAQLRSRWCLERGYGAINNTLEEITSGGPEEDQFRMHGPNCDHGRPINVLKLHGSINWYVRMNGKKPNSRMLAGDADPPAIFCTNRRAVPHQLRFWQGHQGRGRSQWYTWPVIIPPIHDKSSLIRRFVQPAWSDARQALQAADRLVFFGYSLPKTDVNAEKLFARSVGRAADELDHIDVIDPDPQAAARYASLSQGRPLRWYPTADAYLESGTV